MDKGWVWFSSNSSLCGCCVSCFGRGRQASSARTTTYKQTTRKTNNNQISFIFIEKMQMNWRFFFLFMFRCWNMNSKKVRRSSSVDAQARRTTKTKREMIPRTPSNSWRKELNVKGQWVSHQSIYNEFEEVHNCTNEGWRDTKKQIKISHTILWT